MHPDIPAENPIPEKGVEIDTGSPPEEINLDPGKENPPPEKSE